jgi:hypothetical protein
MRRKGELILLLRAFEVDLELLFQNKKQWWKRTRDAGESIAKVMCSCAVALTGATAAMQS